MAMVMAGQASPADAAETVGLLGPDEAGGGQSSSQVRSTPVSFGASFPRQVIRWAVAVEHCPQALLLFLWRARPTPLHRPPGGFFSGGDRSVSSPSPLVL